MYWSSFSLIHGWKYCSNPMVGCGSNILNTYVLGRFQLFGVRALRVSSEVLWISVFVLLGYLGEHFDGWGGSWERVGIPMDCRMLPETTKIKVIWCSKVKCQFLRPTCDQLITSWQFLESHWTGYQTSNWGLQAFPCTPVPPQGGLRIQEYIGVVCGYEYICVYIDSGCGPTPRRADHPSREFASLLSRWCKVPCCMASPCGRNVRPSLPLLEVGLS